MPKHEFIDDPEMTKLGHDLGMLNIRLMNGKVSVGEVTHSPEFRAWEESVWVTTEVRITTAGILGTLPSRNKNRLRHVNDDSLGGPVWELNGSISGRGIYTLPAETTLYNERSPFLLQTIGGNALANRHFRGNIIVAQIVLGNGEGAFVPFVTPSEDGFTPPLMTKFEKKVI